MWRTPVAQKSVEKNIKIEKTKKAPGKKIP
jgi:hypothetical protein